MPNRSGWGKCSGSGSCGVRANAVRTVVVSSTWMDEGRVDRRCNKAIRRTRYYYTAVMGGEQACLPHPLSTGYPTLYRVPHPLQGGSHVRTYIAVPATSATSERARLSPSQGTPSHEIICETNCRLIRPTTWCPAFTGGRHGVGWKEAKFSLLLSVELIVLKTASLQAHTGGGGVDGVDVRT